MHKNDMSHKEKGDTARGAVGILVLKQEQRDKGKVKRYQK
jgi:hypothetical protein